MLIVKMLKDLPCTLWKSEAVSYLKTGKSMRQCGDWEVQDSVRRDRVAGAPSRRCEHDLLAVP